MTTVIKSGASANQLTINSESEATVTFNTDKTKVGLVALSSRSGDGSATGEILARDIDITDDFALRSSVDQLLFVDNFVGVAINTGNWNQSSGTYTITQGNGYCTLNSASSTASNAGSMISSYRYIPLYGSTTVYVQFQVRATGITQGQKTIEFGLGTSSTSLTVLLDGIVFRFGPYGELRGVINHNGFEIVTDPFNINILDGEAHQYIMGISMNGVDFFIDGIHVGTINSHPLNDSLTQAGSLPVIARINFLGGTSTIDFPPRLDIFFVQVWSSGNNFSRTFAEQMSLCGNNANTGTTGFSTLGTQCNISNSLTLVSSTVTNTALPSGGYTGFQLGGEFQFIAPASANTDLIIFAYTVPVVAVASQPRTLIVTDLWINTVNIGAAVATTPTVIVWSLGYGSTAVALTTADGAATKASRRVPLGMQSFIVGDAIGMQRNPIKISFSTPVVVYTGQVLHVIAKVPLGTATASQNIRGLVGINGYWE